MAEDTEITTVATTDLIRMVAVIHLKETIGMVFHHHRRLMAGDQHGVQVIGQIPDFRPGHKYLLQNHFMMEAALTAVATARNLETLTAVLPEESHHL